jgi:hypothetical protein
LSRENASTPFVGVEAPLFWGHRGGTNRVLTSETRAQPVRSRLAPEQPTLARLMLS